MLDSTVIPRGLSVLIMLALVLSCFASADPAASSGTFTLWQLPNQTRSQMLSDVIQPPSGGLILIDGGTAGDAPYLRQFILDHGGKVAAWFITHPHSDHCNGFCAILEDPQGVEIGPIYASLPESAWIDELCDPEEKMTYHALVATLEKTQRTVTPLSLGQTIDIGGVHIEVLSIHNPELRKNAINNSSVILKLTDAQKSILLLGDAGLEAGNKVLAGPYADKLHVDYVQMAHHGQNGVSEAFYQKVNPAYCLWPTPKWLWDNDLGQGPNTGHWKTLEVRAWMDKFPIKKHYLMWEGIQKIE